MQWPILNNWVNWVPVRGFTKGVSMGVILYWPLHLVSETHAKLFIFFANFGREKVIFFGRKTFLSVKVGWHGQNYDHKTSVVKASGHFTNIEASWLVRIYAILMWLLLGQFVKIWASSYANILSHGSSLIKVLSHLRPSRRWQTFSVTCLQKLIWKQKEA